MIKKGTLIIITSIVLVVALLGIGTVAWIVYNREVTVNSFELQTMPGSDLMFSLDNESFGKDITMPEDLLDIGYQDLSGDGYGVYEPKLNGYDGSVILTETWNLAESCEEYLEFSIFFASPTSGYLYLDKTTFFSPVDPDNYADFAVAASMRMAMFEDSSPTTTVTKETIGDVEVETTTFTADATPLGANLTNTDWERTLFYAPNDTYELTQVTTTTPALDDDGNEITGEYTTTTTYICNYYGESEYTAKRYDYVAVGASSCTQTNCNDVIQINTTPAKDPETIVDTNDDGETSDEATTYTIAGANSAYTTPFATIVGGTTEEIKIRMWVEGEDRDCCNAIVEGKINCGLVFGFSYDEVLEVA